MSMRARAAVAGLAFLAAMAFLSFHAAAQGEGSVERGKKIFLDTGPEEYPDYPSCAQCHTTVPAAKEAETGHIRPGHSLYNVTARPSFKNKPKGKGPKTAGDAGNICVRAFQKRKALPPEKVADLNAYLQSISTGESAKPLKIGYAPRLMKDLDGGDKTKGKKKYEIYCTTCHGDSDDDIYVALKPGRWNRVKVLRKARGYIPDKRKEAGVRFKANNGMMSFFAEDRLPDADLRDILAYVGKIK